MIDKKNEIIVPKAKMSICVLSIVGYIFNNLYAVAAAKVGTARKKENSAASFLFIPSAKPPRIVAPDLLTPGQRAKH